MKTGKPAGIGITEAASRFESILSFEDTQSTEAAPAPEAAATDNQVEATAADDAADKTPPSDNGEVDEDAEAVEADDSAEVDDEDGEAAEDATDESEAEAEQPIPETQLFTVKINGKDEQVALKEVLAGYSRTADYTRKSQALAEERKVFEPERDAIRLERQQYAQLIPALIEQIKETLFAEPDWDKLIEVDPAEYVRQERLWREKQDRLAAAHSEHTRLQEIHDKEQQDALTAMIRDSSVKLTEAMPQWKNTDKWTADRQKLLEYGQTLGYSAEDLKATYDHRAIVALYKAMRYDEIMAKRPKPNAPSGPKPLPAGSSPQRQQRTVNDVTRAKQRLAKTGRVQDAASVFERML